MVGARSGCRATVQKKTPLAGYIHCMCCSSLNLADVSACKAWEFKNTDFFVGEISRFFGFLPKRKQFLEKAIKTFNPTLTAKKLKDACHTCWIQCIEAHIVFLELLPTAHRSSSHDLSWTEVLSTGWNWDGDTVTKAN